jgi:hypothetical protein
MTSPLGVMEGDKILGQQFRIMRPEEKRYSSEVGQSRSLPRKSRSTSRT